MTPLATGIYIITNRRHRNVAILPDTNKHSDIVAGIQENGPGKMWNVNRLSNGTYKIQNCDHHSFANIENSTKASQGDGIVGGSRPQQWKIIEMRSKGDYCICPTTNTDVCWSLPDGETDSPIVLGCLSNARQNQWNFTKVEDNHVARIQASTTTFYTHPASGPTPSMSKPAAFAPEALGWVTLTSHLERGTSEILEDHEKTIAAKSERPNTEGQQISAIERHPPLDSVKEDKHVAPIAGEKGRLAEERQAEEQDWSLAQRDQTMCADPISIHSAILPMLNVTLHEALLIDFPSCVNPLDCINADANHINGIVQGLLALTQRGEFRHAVFAGSMIYRRLIVYIYAHLMLCTSEKRFLNEFEETLQQWRDWDNITVVQNHRLIKDHLYDIFHRGLKVQSNPTLHSEDIFFKLVALDAIGLCAHLTVMVTDDTIYKEMLKCRGPGAQALLNLLQARLEFPINPRHKACHVKALLRLSRASGLCPECLVLKGIKMEAHPIDRGGYGDVYKGVLHGQEIAVKALRIYQTSDLLRLLKEFSSEAVLWRQLSHPNVLPFYGVYHLDETTPRLCLTAPWMENGNVVEFLKRYPDTYCIHLALDVIQGLKYLHNFAPSIIHGDLKGVNILVTRSGRACLADFGLATAIDSKTIAVTHSSTAKSGGTMRWQAPELLSIGADEADDDQHNSKASDIYAFACVCYEMLSGEIPFFENPYDIQVILGVMRGRRPARPMHELCRTRGISDELWDLIQICWAQNPTERPAADQIMERLQALPNWQDDRRPLDDCSVSFPYQAVHNHPEHPFSALATAITDGNA